MRAVAAAARRARARRALEAEAPREVVHDLSLSNLSVAPPRAAAPAARQALHAPADRRHLQLLVRIVRDRHRGASLRARRQIGVSEVVGREMRARRRDGRERGCAPREWLGGRVGKVARHCSSAASQMLRVQRAARRTLGLIPTMACLPVWRFTTYRGTSRHRWRLLHAEQPLSFVLAEPRLASPEKSCYSAETLVDFHSSPESSSSSSSFHEVTTSQCAPPPSCSPLGLVLGVQPRRRASSRPRSARAARPPRW